MAEVRWLDDEESAAWRAWVQLTTRVRAAIGRDLARDHGMSDAEYAVLVTLSEAPDRRVRMTDLAIHLEWSRSRLSHLVGRMEARGLVSRVDCPDDGRGSFAALTAVGLAEIQRAAPGHVASVRRHFLDLLDREQLLQLRVVTEAAIDRLDALTGPCLLSAGGPLTEGDPLGAGGCTDEPGDADEPEDCAG